MSAAMLGSLIIWLIIAVVVVVIVVYLVNWLYHRSSKELSFVRTGLFGEKVVINGVRSSLRPRSDAGQHECPAHARRART